MKKLFLLLIVLVFLASCASFAPMGLVYSDGKVPVAATDNAQDSKTGEACMTTILSLVATGDSSVEAAKANGGITKVSSIDYKVKNILGVYGEYCTVVKGE